MKKKLLILLPLASAVLFSGCATLFGGGSSQTISINSTKPVKATVSYEDGSNPQYITAPATIKVDRKNENIIITSKNNEFQDVKVDKHVNGWFWVNILSAPGGTVLSSTIDAATGSMWRYDETVTIQEK